MGTPRPLLNIPETFSHWSFDELGVFDDLIDSVGPMLMNAQGSMPSVTGLVNGGRGTISNNNFTTPAIAGVTPSNALRAILENGAYTFYFNFTYLENFTTSYQCMFVCKDQGASPQAHSLNVYTGNSSGSVLVFYWDTNGVTAGVNFITTYHMNFAQSAYDCFALRVTPTSGGLRNLDFFVNGTLRDSLTNQLAPNTSYNTHLNQKTNINNDNADWFYSTYDEFQINQSTDSNALILSNYKRLKGTNVYLASLSAATGSQGSTITITGENFSPSTSITFGGVPVSSYTYISLTQVSVVLGNHAQGAVDVVATDTDTSYNTLSGAFTYLSSGPTLISIPSPVSVGQYITIAGTNFDSTSTLSISGINLVTGLQDSTHLNVLVPDIVGGPFDTTATSKFTNPSTLIKSVVIKNRGS